MALRGTLGSHRSGGILVYHRGGPLSFTLWCRADRAVYTNSSSNREMLTILTIFGLWAWMGHFLSLPLSVFPLLRRSLLVRNGSFGAFFPRG